MTNGLRRTKLMICTATALTLTGCSWFGGGGGGGNALQPDKFERSNPPGTILSRHQLADEHQPLYNEVRVVDLDPNSPQNARVGVRTGIGDQRVRDNEMVTSVSRASVELAERKPTGSLPATTRPTTLRSSGEYMMVGSIVTTVNNVPIYADKILSRLGTALAANAKQMTEDQYRGEAMRLIVGQVQQEVRNELVFLEADKSLEAREKELADNLTAEWRRKEVINRGGSIEQTRAFYADQGLKFDDVLNDKYREYVVAIYYQKKIFPKVQVTADDMRHFYERNKAKRYATTEEATFRLIKIDGKAVGQGAKVRAQEVHDRAVKGEDFQLLSTQFNNDVRLKAAGGLEQPIRKGDYANTKVEEAVFASKPGRVTDIIEVNGNFYIAKVEQKTDGRVRPFEDPEVQAEIKDILRKEQMQPMVELQQERLKANAAINPDPPRIEPLLEMAMQKYPEWAKK